MFFVDQVEGKEKFRRDVFADYFIRTGMSELRGIDSSWSS